MRKNIVAGNWKMNKNLQEGIALAKELNEALAADKPNCDVVICTPFIHLASVTPIVDKAVIGVGAENCADKVSGAYTGEVSAEMVASTGAEYVILGHSERRCSIVTMFHNREAGSGNCEAGSCRNIECIFSVTSGSYDINRSEITQIDRNTHFQQYIVRTVYQNRNLLFPYVQAVCCKGGLCDE